MRRSEQAVRPIGSGDRRPVENVATRAEAAGQSELLEEPFEGVPEAGAPEADGAGEVGAPSLPSLPALPDGFFSEPLPSDFGPSDVLLGPESLDPEPLEPEALVPEVLAPEVEPE